MKVVRDPLWQNIELEPLAAAVIDTAAFQRLRYIRQLGHAFLVYPGATHTRFEHALGTYALARRALDRLPASPPARQFITIGALLHDIGHYPFSHALEESGLASHETVGQQLLGSGELAEVLGNAGYADPAAEFGALMRGESTHPLAGLISGSIDLDKIDYLRRDAFHCGVPYGDVDVDRLVACLTLVDDDGIAAVGILEKGVAALESLLFAKYQMYRNVYWHHAVRAATAMFKRLVHEAVVDRDLDIATLAEANDDWLMHDLLQTDRTGLAEALRGRKLYKRVLEIEAPEGLPDWLRGDPARLARAENDLGKVVGLGPAELLIDYPWKESMLALNLPILLKGGTVHHLTQEGWPGRMDLPPFANNLARSACRLRVFTRRPVDMSVDMLQEILRT